jgi:hypothetical protein
VPTPWGGGGAGGRPAGGRGGAGEGPEVAVVTCSIAFFADISACSSSSELWPPVALLLPSPPANPTSACCCCCSVCSLAARMLSAAARAGSAALCFCQHRDHTCASRLREDSATVWGGRGSSVTSGHGLSHLLALLGGLLVVVDLPCLAKLDGRAAGSPL